MLRLRSFHVMDAIGISRRVRGWLRADAISVRYCPNFLMCGARRVCLTSRRARVIPNAVRCTRAGSLMSRHPHGSSCSDVGWRQVPERPQHWRDNGTDRFPPNRAPCACASSMSDVLLVRVWWCEPMGRRVRDYVPCREWRGLPRLTGMSGVSGNAQGVNVVAPTLRLPAAILCAGEPGRSAWSRVSQNATIDPDRRSGPTEAGRSARNCPHRGADVRVTPCRVRRLREPSQ